ncbi:MAG: glycosyltransferase family 9 protein [Armatimonadetes bacterium]|nr:glycosyltransferase family 9 protein [Armatimonadota bacterium]
MTVEAPKRILIVKLSAIGDVLMATPASRVLRNAFPDAYIAWIVEKKSADIVLGNPYLDEVIVWERSKGGGSIKETVRFIKGLIALRKKLISRNFNVCVDLQGLLRSAAVSLVSGAKRRIGFSDAGECATLLYNEKLRPSLDDLNAQQRNIDILQPLGINSRDCAMFMPVLEDDHVFAGEFFKNADLEGKKVVAFIPATTWVNKHWTLEGWSRIADLLGERGVKSLILGSKADIPLAAKIFDGATYKPTICAGQTSLKQAGALMERCIGVIGVDTGLLHMAVALDRPAVGLFGASAWRCFQRKDNFIWVAKDFACSPCRRHPTCDNIDCMQAISPEEVAGAIAPWLE